MSCWERKGKRYDMVWGELELEGGIERMWRMCGGGVGSVVDWISSCREQYKSLTGVVESNRME